MVSIVKVLKMPKFDIAGLTEMHADSVGDESVTMLRHVNEEVEIIVQKHDAAVLDLDPPESCAIDDWFCARSNPVRRCEQLR